MIMKLTFNISDQDYEVDYRNGLHISIPLNFNGDQPNTYEVKRAFSEPYKAGEFIGSVALGGACNFETYQLVPHCNGTHTECIGHISEDRIEVHKDIEDSLIPACVISVKPENALESGDSYTPELEERDYLISAASLEKALQNTHQHFCEALVIRTLPNENLKKSISYMNDLPAFFSHEAIRFIQQKGVKHLLVDLPSVDRTFDDGLLSNHRIYWNVAPGVKKIDSNKTEGKSITEMIYVEDKISDGNYLLNLQMAAFMGDASPSRPILYKIKPV
jgi:arylformamidase